MKKPLKLSFGAELQGYELREPGEFLTDILHDSVDEIHLFHVANKLRNDQFFPFFDDLYRALKPGGLITSVTPYFKSVRAHIDPLAVRSVSEGTYAYFSPAWRKANKVPYQVKAKFEIVKTDYTINQNYLNKAQEAVQSAAVSFWDVIDDMVVILKK